MRGIDGRLADLEIGDTADWEVCGTHRRLFATVAKKLHRSSAVGKSAGRFLAAVVEELGF